MAVLSDSEIQQALGSTWGNIYLGVVLIAVCVCTLAIQSATIRLMFSMSQTKRAIQTSYIERTLQIPHLVSLWLI